MNLAARIQILVLLFAFLGSADVVWAQDSPAPPTLSEHDAGAKDQARTDVLGSSLLTVGISLAAALITYTLAIITAFSVLYFGSWTKHVLEQLLNTMACISPLSLLLIIYAARESHGILLVVFLGLSIYPLIGRQLLSRVSEAADQFQFMQAKVLGHSPFGVFIDYAWPKFLPLTLPYFFFGFIYSLLMESMFSSLGLLALPTGDTWGSLIHLGADKMIDEPWQIFYAGYAIIIASLVAYVCIPIFDRLLSVPKA